MESEDIKQIIVIKTEHMNRETHLGLIKLVHKYYFQFNSIAQENSDYKMIHEITFEANFYSLGQMFDFNKELQEILINNK
jgi:hypothetical protein